MGLDTNRTIHDKNGNTIDIIKGDFFVCGVKDDEFISLSPELMEKYKTLFYEPKALIMENGKTIADVTPLKKTIAEQMKKGAEQAAEYNAARIIPDKKPDIDRD